MIPVRRALLAVHDKTGLEDFARGLHDAGVEILSTGGTAKALEAAGVPVTAVADVTGFPELFGGRVKTLHPKIHGGILFRRHLAEDQREAQQHGITGIDLVAVSLYPFEKTIASEGATPGKCIDEIDIGGPALIRAAAKNHEHVVVVTDVADYAAVLQEIQDRGGVTHSAARELAARAFARVSAYDATIAAWMTRQSATEFEEVVLRGHRAMVLRYGENPHQQAAACAVPGEHGGVLQARIVQGRELSYNNLVDLDAAWSLVRDLEGGGVGIIKHANPCGAAEAGSLADALSLARACDPVSAFGGIYAFNGPVDRATAAALVEGFFVEGVIAPSFEAGALEVLAGKKDVRVLEGGLPPRRRDGEEWKRIIGGFLLQDWDDVQLHEAELTVATKRAPTRDEMKALLFAWRVTRHVKSNAIVLCSGTRTLGIGAGQSSRVDAAELAVLKAKKHGLALDGSVVASDAFFPFRDGLDVAARAGATAAIQPGGSKRDDEVIAAANEHGMAMVFTGRRHFRH